MSWALSKMGWIGRRPVIDDKTTAMSSAQARAMPEGSGWELAEGARMLSTKVLLMALRKGSMRMAKRVPARGQP